MLVTSIHIVDGGKVTVDLSAASGTLAVEWFNPSTSESVPAESSNSGGSREFTAPFDGDAVLYITNGE